MKAKIIAADGKRYTLVDYRVPQKGEWFLKKFDGRVEVCAANFTLCPENIRAILVSDTCPTCGQEIKHG